MPRAGIEYQRKEEEIRGGVVMAKNYFISLSRRTA